MINIPKGTRDMLPADAFKWHFVENVARRVAESFGFEEMRTPTFEHTELFLRGVGETTDIVNKEMYTFTDKGGRSITLRPEGTAGVARSFIENGLQQGIMPMKAYYLASIFRYERPQNGRLREHHQFGVELYGSESPMADAEVIMLANAYLKAVGLEKLELNLNSIGCDECRKNYNAALKAYIGENLDGMCEQCKVRFEKNPLRILDCKEEKCKKITAGAPKITDFLCDECKKHFEELQNYLKAVNIPFKVNPMIVRGLDYYTRTVFEFVSTDIGAQGTVCGGGRYNNLVEEVGGKHTPAVGFGLGLERLLLVLESVSPIEKKAVENSFYVAPITPCAKELSLKIVQNLRENGLRAETDLMDKSVKAQFKYADKLGAEWVVVLGEDELASGVVVGKNMFKNLEKSWTISDLLASPLGIDLI